MPGEVLSSGAHRIKVRRAQELRGAPTDAEALLWEELRRRRIGGWKFRRQHPIAGYIVDFYCPALGLAIEVDGPAHLAREPEDRSRSAILAQLGVRVVRVRNDDVLASPTTIARRITLLCKRISPFPPRSGERGPGG